MYEGYEKQWNFTSPMVYRLFWRGSWFYSFSTGKYKQVTTASFHIPIDPPFPSYSNYITETTSSIHHIPQGIKHFVLRPICICHYNFLTNYRREQKQKFGTAISDRYIVPHMSVRHWHHMHLVLWTALYCEQDGPGSNSIHAHSTSASLGDPLMSPS